MSQRSVIALGLMSGTSCDGVDAAIIETDGERVHGLGAAHYRPYAEAERTSLRAALEAAGAWPAGAPMPQAVRAAEQVVTRAHIEAAHTLLRESGLAPGAVQLIGFHGQTVLHQPARGRTVQIGDAARLAAETGIDVVHAFRSADVAAGGQGAPFVPLYHAALARKLEGPLLVVNIGGVSNVTYIDRDSAPIAFDTGPGNAPIDDWVRTHLGVPFDDRGAIAAQGIVDEARIARGLAHPYFTKPPPKSLDRMDFTMQLAEGLAPHDGAATLAAFTAASIAAARAHLPAPPRRALVTGGGRHNPVLMRELGARLGVPVDPVEAVGWRGDILEAEAFGFLAVRHLRGLPLSLPTTTGVPHPMPGGRLARAQRPE
jgi:anhydro-N-acetylmuramic acid kinase